jgi:hypothetical protein
VYTGDASEVFGPSNPEGTYIFTGANKLGGAESKESGASRSGTVLKFGVVKAEAFAFGSWAVTAPPAP